MTLELETQLYRALWQKTGDDEEIIRLCQKTTEGPFSKCTMYNNTVLHTAIYMKRYRLANELLDHLPNSLFSRLCDQNDWGNTLLHDVATSNKGLELTNKLLQKAPKLLHAHNKWGETAIFQATRYGKNESFKFLANEVDRFCRTEPGYDCLHNFRRQDGTTVLHMAILTSNFSLALFIAEKYPELCHLRDKNGMSPLQMLACSPTAFKSGVERGSFIKELVYSNVDPDIEDEVGHNKIGIFQKAVLFILGMPWKPRCILPMLETTKEVKRSHKVAEKLAKFLIQSDTSWRMGPKPSPELTPRIGGVGGDDISLTEEDKAEHELESGTSLKRRKSSSCSIPDVEEIPLILAAKYGCVEIVKEILHKYPQAMEYLNNEQQTFFHVAIKNRNLGVFKLVDPEISPIRSQLRAIDVKGNSLLHMVGISSSSKKIKFAEDSKMKSPVIRLSEDLQLLEYLKRWSPSCLINHRNSDMLTADELFATNNEELRNEAKEWLKRTAEHCTVVIVLIATVAFAAAYTVPGGPNSQTGYPLLISKPLFLVFTVADVLSLGFALTAVVIFLAILTSSFQLKEFRRSLPEKLLIGFTLLFLSVSMMMVAFAATIILMINNKERWTKIGVYVVAFFPVCIFMLSYIPLYVKLFQSLKDWVLKIGKSLPRIRFASRNSRKKSSTIV